MTEHLPTATEIDAALSGADEAARQKMTGWAEQGSVEAQLVLGQMLMDGRGGPVDRTGGFNWFLRAARAGHPMASNMVGRCYENGWGVEAAMDLASSWFRRAAEAGLNWGMYNHATSLALGRGVVEDKVAAKAWLVRAVALNHAKSMTVLGGFFEDGWAGPRDMAEARRLYRAGAEGGDFRGHFNLARLLADEGRMDEAGPHFRAAHADGTPAFREKLLDFLGGSETPGAAELAAQLRAATT